MCCVTFAHSGGCGCAIVGYCGGSVYVGVGYGGCWLWLQRRRCCDSGGYSDVVVVIAEATATSLL